MFPSGYFTFGDFTQSLNTLSAYGATVPLLQNNDVFYRYRVTEKWKYENYLALTVP